MDLKRSGCAKNDGDEEKKPRILNAFIKDNRPRCPRNDGDEVKKPSRCPRILSIKDYAAAVKAHQNVACLVYETRKNVLARMVDQSLEELAKRHPDTCFRKICGPKHPNLVKHLAIEKYPTVVLVKNTRPVHLVVPSEVGRAMGEFSMGILESILYDHGIVPTVEKEEPDYLRMPGGKYPDSQYVDF